jgi:hypothetical protein
MRPVVIALALLGAVAIPAPAQAVIDPGMTREQVVERLGKPVGERTLGARTYLFYRNGCERRCGMHDFVMLEEGAVTDAVFRASSRRYTGESSSPAGRTPVNQGSLPANEGAGSTGAGSGGGSVIIANPPAGGENANARARGRAGRNDVAAPTTAAIRGSAAGSVVTGGDSAASPRAADNAARSPRPPMARGGQPAAGYRTDTVAGPGSPLRAGSGNRGAQPAPNYKPNPADSVRNANPPRQQPDSVRPPEI